MKLIEKRGKYFCPVCGSKRVYVEVSTIARQSPNTNRIYSHTNVIDNIFWGAGCGCEKCGWTGGDQEL